MKATPAPRPTPMSWAARVGGTNRVGQAGAFPGQAAPAPILPTPARKCNKILFVIETSIFVTPTLHDCNSVSLWLLLEKPDFVLSCSLKFIAFYISIEIYKSSILSAPTVLIRYNSFIGYFWC